MNPSINDEITVESFRHLQTLDFAAVFNDLLEQANEVEWPRERVIPVLRQLWHLAKALEMDEAVEWLEWELMK